jgi:hypothetical protein
MLISVHMPKTAGTSFTASLRGHFGDRLALAYNDRPLHQAAWRRNGQAASRALANRLRRPLDTRIECVHGHFLPIAFRWARFSSPVQYVTWLRDPVQRLVSHYEHWRREPDPPASDTLHHRMLEENWSFEEFAFRPELRNVYSGFLWGFPVERFDFIGISEDYDTELGAFGQRVLGAHLNSARERENPDRAGDGYEIDPALRRRIEDFHAADVNLYARALALRDQRRG